MAGQDVVLIDRSSEPVSTARLVQVVRALQTQIDRDFAAAWGACARLWPATVGSLPDGAWAIAIVDEPPAGGGIRTRPDGRPLAEVRRGRDWTIVASHLLLEMLADPHGTRLVEGRDSTSPSRAPRVRYLVEVCDPCRRFHYEVEGVVVSDFVTPDFYRASAPPGTALDFLRRIRRPLEVPRGGHLSWQDLADGRWHERGADGSTSVSAARYDPARNPRADRDGAFPASRRHELSATRRARRAVRAADASSTGGESS